MRRSHLSALLACCCLAASASAVDNVFSVSGDQVLYNGTPFKVIGLRLSNALISDAEVDELVSLLPTYKSYGINTVSVFVMGSRFGDLKGYRPDASLDPAVAVRLHTVLDATDDAGMALLVGCLYWGTSQAKADLGGWTQSHANQAVANTVTLLRDSGHRHVFVDPDNEGMANASRGWSIQQMIAAAKAVTTEIPIGYNDTASPPANADVLMHFSPKDGARPWIQSEGSAGSIPNPPGGGYWGTYSKQTHQADSSYHNYSRIGRYTNSMKTSQINASKNDINNRAGYMLASTWIQCGPEEGIGGPFMHPGGDSNIADVNANIDDLHPDAGVLWWFKAMKSAYGPWVPPGSNPGPGPGPDPDAGAFVEQSGELSIEAEHYATRSPSTFANYSQIHEWFSKTDRAGYSGSGSMQVLPDERGEDANGPGSPRDNSGAEMTYPIHVTTAGTYHVFVRGMSMGGESNGVHVGVDGQLSGTGPGASNMSGFRPHNEWIWENGRKDGYSGTATLQLSAGSHILNVWNRDDAFRIDKIVLRTSGTEPSGTGPAESGRAGDDPTDPPVDDAPAVTQVYLIDAATDTRIQQLGEFTTIDLSAVGDQLSFEAVANGATESVRFSLDDGARVQLENIPPYSFTGDDFGDFHPFTPSIGSHVLTLTPYAGNSGGGDAGPVQSYAFSVVAGGFAGVKINFQPAGAPVPGGHLVDSGQAFGSRGDGRSYGWDQANDETRDRGVLSDQRYDTLNHLQKGADRTWEIAVPDGIYAVRIVASDPSYIDQANHLLVEGVAMRDSDPLTDHFDDHTVEAEVTDGRLTITPASDAQNAKISLVEIESLPSGSN